MTAPWSPLDFGAPVSGDPGVTLTGAANPYLLNKKVTVIVSAASGSVVELPQSYAAGTELRILNRTTTTVLVSPGPSNQIESSGTGVSVGIAGPGDAYFTSFDPPATRAPRTWWLT
jgi:hypothetical protein